jgi:hypothetical protein
MKSCELYLDAKKEDYNIKDLVIESFEEAKKIKCKNIAKRCILNMNSKYKIKVSLKAIDNHFN